jgi:hypothetical protein
MWRVDRHVPLPKSKEPLIMQLNRSMATGIACGVLALGGAGTALAACPGMSDGSGSAPTTATTTATTPTTTAAAPTTTTSTTSAAASTSKRALRHAHLRHGRRG